MHLSSSDAIAPIYARINGKDVSVQRCVFTDLVGTAVVCKHALKRCQTETQIDKKTKKNKRVCGTFDICTVSPRSVELFGNVNQKSERGDVGGRTGRSDFTSGRRRSPNPNGVFSCNPEKPEGFFVEKFDSEPSCWTDIRVLA